VDPTPIYTQLLHERRVASATEQVPPEQWPAEPAEDVAEERATA
jgi:hypothetical protein